MLAPTHTMKYRYLGNSGLLVSTLSFGSWVTFDGNFGFDAAYDIMVKAYQSGINFFDNAEGYAWGKSEEIMGQVVQKGIQEGVWTREDLVLTTKIFVGTKQTPGPNDQGLSRKHIIEGTKASLKRMQLDYVDVIYCHRPEASTSIDETVRAMNFIIKQDWALNWGTSEWTSDDIIKAFELADHLGLIRPTGFDHLATTDVWHPERQVHPGHPERRIAAIGSGGRALVPNLDSRIAQTEKLKVVASQLEISLPQLAIAWCLANENVSSVICGVSSVAQLEQNLQTAQFVPLITPQVKQQIDELAQFQPTLPVKPHAITFVRKRHLA